MVGVVEVELEGDRLAGGVEDAVVGAVGFGAALAENFHAGRVHAFLGGGRRNLDDGPRRPVGQPPGVGGEGGGGEERLVLKTTSPPRRVIAPAARPLKYAPVFQREYGRSVLDFCQWVLRQTQYHLVFASVVPVTNSEPK